MDQALAALMQALVCPHSAVLMQLQVTGCYTQWKPYQSAFFALVGWKRCSNHFLDWVEKDKRRYLRFVNFLWKVDWNFQLSCEKLIWRPDFEVSTEIQQSTLGTAESLFVLVSLVKYISLVHLLPSHLSLRDVLCGFWKRQNLLFGFIVAPPCKQWIARFAFTFTILKEHHMFLTLGMFLWQYF